MKRIAYTLATLIVLAASCQNDDETIISAGYDFDFTITACGYSDTKADATVGWTDGEKVFVFFQPTGGSLLGDSYAVFTYVAGLWTPDSYVAPGALGTSGKMAAVYVPYLGEKMPVFGEGQWTINGGDVYYSCTSSATYTVMDGIVYGKLNMTIPDGYVQFSVDSSVASDGDLLTCSYVDAYTCVSITSDMKISSTQSLDNKMVGHADNGKVFFWGKYNESASGECMWTLSTSDGDITMEVSADKVSKNQAYNLTGLHRGVQLWENGPLWATTNVGATKSEEYGYYFSWGNVIGYKISDDSCLYSFTEDNYAITAGASLITDIPADAEYDAAKANWGGDWRMPTFAEFMTLVHEDGSDLTVYEWTEDYNDTGVAGLIVYGKGAYSTKSIFLPATSYVEGTTFKSPGVGFYRSSSLGFVPNNEVKGLFIGSTLAGQSVDSRWSGEPVRPVKDAN